MNTDFKAGLAASGAVGALGAVFAAPTAVVAGGLLAGQTVHTLLTLNPDYVITKDYINAKLTIEYKKKK